MIAPRSLGKRLRDVRQQAECRRCRAGQDEQSEHGDEDGDRDEQGDGQTGAVVDGEAGADERPAAEDAVEDDRRPAHRREAVAPEDEADAEDQADDDGRQRDLDRTEALHERLVREVGVGLGELEDRLAEPQPDATR